MPTPGLWASIQRGLNWQGQSAWQRRGRLTTEVLAAPPGLDAQSIAKLEASPGGRAGGPIAAALIAAPMLGLATALLFFSSAPDRAQLAAFFGGLGIGLPSFIFAVSRFAYRKQLADVRIGVARVLEKFSGNG